MRIASPLAIWTLLLLVVSSRAGANGNGCALEPGISEAQAGSGLCGFTEAQRAFAGTPAEQAKCLLRAPTVARTALRQSNVPANLLALVGTSTQPSIAEVRDYLAVHRIDEADVGGPISSTISADYFVIHDTSTPNCSEDKACPVQGEFPANINSSDWRENRTFIHHKPLDPRQRKVAHVITNRVGESITEVDLKDHLSHVKFDHCVVKDKKDKLFVGVENIQPRKGMPPIPEPGKKPNDFIAPTPGFSDAQYERLALIYVIASARRGHWLIPAYHAVLDWYFRDGHDDPQNFELPRFSDDVSAIARAMASHLAASESRSRPSAKPSSRRTD